jgi:hypothetical protein
MSKSEWVEWDAFPDPPKRRRKQKRIVEVLEPEREQPTIRVDIRHHRSGRTLPQHLVIVAALLILAVIMLRSPGAMILLDALIPSTVLIAFAIIVAILAIVAFREHLAGRPF